MCVDGLREFAFSCDVLNCVEIIRGDILGLEYFDAAEFSVLHREGNTKCNSSELRDHKGLRIREQDP